VNILTSYLAAPLFKHSRYVFGKASHTKTNLSAEQTGVVSTAPASIRNRLWMQSFVSPWICYFLLK